MDAAGQHLFERGWVVIPGVTPGLRADIAKTVMFAPEYRRQMDIDHFREGEKVVCGATSFAGPPSLTHAVPMRRARAHTSAYLMPMLRMFISLVETALGISDLKLARWPDRVMIRPPGLAPSAESWHRDSPDVSRVNEFWTGGWINCNSEPQYFCAIERSHFFTPNETTGFGPIPKDQHADLNVRVKAQANQPGFDKRGYIVVPPGHIVYFASTLAHKVTGKKLDYTDVKMFIGHHFTVYNDSGVFRKKRLIPVEELQQQLKDNAVTYMGSGQRSPMYPANYLVCRDTQLPIYEAFERDILQPGAMNPLRDAEGKILHKAHDDGTRAMRSLAEQGLPLYPAYSESELTMMVPQSEELVIHNYDTHEDEIYSIKRRRI